MFLNSIVEEIIGNVPFLFLYNIGMAQIISIQNGRYLLVHRNHLKERSILAIEITISLRISLI